MSETDTILLDLLLRYEEAIERGESPTPEGLCGEHPELVEPLRQRLRGLDRLARYLRPGDTVPEEGEPGHSTGPTLGGYELVEELGRGGMGVVYKARQPGLNRLVALKLLLGGAFASPGQRARFRLEAEAVARLRHPNIVQVIEVGEHEGQPFLTLEFCPGGSLAERLRRDGPFAIREAAECVRALAEAIQAAHDAKIVHRDLKPANVLLDERGTLRVGDFGLAKDLGEGPSLTGDAVVGTPAYMAPEQAAGRNRDVGPLADVWALGGILYALLTGRPPFQAPSQQETLRQVLTQEPPRPRSLRREVPRDLETICLKCLEKDPKRRYASAQELADDLGRFLAGEPVLARPVGPLGRAWRFCRRYPVQVGLAAAVVLSLTVGATAATLFGLEANEQRGKAEQLAREKGAEATRAMLLAQEKAAEAERAEKQRFRAEALAYARDLELIYRRWRDGESLTRLRERLDDSSWEMLGWEHRFLLRLTSREGPRYLGLAGKASVVAFSPDGKLIALGGGSSGQLLLPRPGVPPRARGSGEVRLFETETGRLVRSLLGLGGRVLSLEFRPDGRELLVASADGSVGRYDPTTGRRLARLDGLQQPLQEAAYLGADRIVAVAGSFGDAPGGILVWDAATGEPVYHRDGEANCFCVAVARDGREFYTGEIEPDTGAAVTARDAATGRPLRHWVLPSLPGAVLRLTLDPTGTVLLAENMPGRVERPLTSNEVVGCDPKTGRVLYRFARSVPAFGPNGLLATVAVGGRLSLRDARSGQELASRQLAREPSSLGLDTPKLPGLGLPGGPARGGEYVVGLAVHPDGKRLLAVDAIGADTTLIDLTRDPQYRRLPGGVAAPVGPAAAELVVADEGTTYHRYRAESGTLVGELAAPTWEAPVHVVAIAPHPDGQRLALATGWPATSGDLATCEVQVWDREQGHVVRRLATVDGPVTTLSWCPDGRHLAGARPQGGVTVWDTDTGQAVVSHAGDGVPPSTSYRAPVVRPVFSPDGRALLYQGAGGKLRLVETRTGQEEQTFTAFVGAGCELRFLAEGRQVLAVGTHRHVCDRATGKPLEQSVLDATGWTVALSAAGDRLAQAGGDGRVKLRDATTGAVVRTCEAVEFGPPSQLGFSPDGRWLAGAFGTPGAGAASPVVVWDTATGEIRQKLSGHAQAVHSLAFSPDGKVLYTGGDDGRLVWWHPTLGRRLGEATIQARNRPQIAALAGAADGLVVAGSRTGALFAWEPGAEQQPRPLGSLGGHITALAVAPDGCSVAVVAGDGIGRDVRLARLDRTTGEAAWSVGLGRSRVQQVEFSRDGRFLLLLTGGSLFGGRDLEVRDAATGGLLRTVAGPGEQLNGLAVHPDGQRVVLGAAGGTLHVVEIATGRVEREFGSPAQRAGVAIDPTGRRLATGTGGMPGDGGLTLWDVPTGQALLTLDRDFAGTPDRLWFAAGGRCLVQASLGAVCIWDASADESPRRLAGKAPACWSPDGSRIATFRSLERSWSLAETRSGKEVLALRGGPSRGLAVAFTSDGRRVVTLAAGDEDDPPRQEPALTVWDAGTGAALETWRLGTEPTALALHPDGRRVALAGQGGVAFLDLATGKEGGRFADGHDGPVVGVVYTPDGAGLLSLGADGVALLREAASGAVRRRFALVAGAARAAAFTPDGNRLVVAGGGKGGELVLWDVTSGQRLGTLEGHPGPVRAVAIGPKGRWVASASGPLRDPFDLFLGDRGVANPNAPAVANHVLLHDLATGRVVRRYEREEGVRSLAFHPSRPWLLVGTQEGTAVVGVPDEAEAGGGD